MVIEPEIEKSRPTFHGGGKALEKSWPTSPTSTSWPTFCRPCAGPLRRRLREPPRRRPVPGRGQRPGADHPRRSSWPPRRASRGGAAIRDRFTDRCLEAAAGRVAAAGPRAGESGRLGGQEPVLGPSTATPCAGGDRTGCGLRGCRGPVEATLYGLPAVHPRRRTVRRAGGAGPGARTEGRAPRRRPGENRRPASPIRGLEEATPPYGGSGVFFSIAGRVSRGGAAAARSRILSARCPWWQRPEHRKKRQLPPVATARTQEELSIATGGNGPNTGRIVSCHRWQ